jgi:DNA repair exonuclease SbcCD ATPase subunit
MLHFEKLRWKNFLSTGNVFTEIQLDRSPSTVVIGENGAGKSTMLDALCWVLFNKPFRDIRMLQLINSVNKKDTRAEVEFHIGTNQYKVVRGYKPSVFEIWKNGELLPQPGNVKDYQVILEETILKLNYKSFTQIVVLGNASFTPFMQLSVKDRREVIEDLLDIQIFSNMNTLLRDRLSKNKNDVTDLNYQIELVENKIDVQNEMIEKLEADVNAQIKEIITERKEYELKYQTAETESLKLSQEVDELLKQVVNEQKVKSKSAKVSELLQKLHDKHHSTHKKASFFKTNDHCPTCEQIIELQLKQQKITESEDVIKELDNGITTLSEEKKKLEDEITIITGLQTEIGEKQVSIRDYQSEMKHMKDNGKSANTRIRTLQTKTVKDHSAKDKVKELKQELSDLGNDKEQLIHDKEVLDIASKILKDGGIKTKIIRQYVPVINKLVNKYLAAMDFFVNFELDEEFNEVIKSRGRDDFSYASFSEGEKARIDLSLMLTWRAVAKLKNSVNTNLLILDEIFDSSLDANGVEILMGLFNELTDTNIFVISHKGDMMVDKFRSQIKFEKVKSFSRMAV